MQRFHLLPIILSTMIFANSACGGAPTVTPSPPVTTPPPQIATQTNPTNEIPTSETTVDPELALPDFSQAKFDQPTNINHKWFPLTPGTRYVFNGTTEEGGKTFPHSIIYTVTDLTKEIAGVKTVVVYILDYSDSQLVEAEIAFYAQDNDGNIWFLGEYPEVYENGQLTEAPCWIHGFKGAKAGIVMKADPQPGMLSYAQGWGPAVNWNDRGRVIDVGQTVCIKETCYEDVLVIEEFSLSESNAFQVKYYAPGIGNIRVGWRGEDATHENLELAEFTQLDADTLAEVRSAALALEQSALKNSKEVYAQTALMEH